VDKYQPLGVLAPGIDGPYLSLPVKVLAVAFAVHLLQ
jgi:hypothetical protein